MEGEESKNWSEKVEDLIDSGDIDAAISFLETLISQLQTLNSHPSQLVSVLLELANLYSSKGLSLKSDDARSRATTLNLRSLNPPPQSPPENPSGQEDDSRIDAGNSGRCVNSSSDNVAPKESSDDDWEAIVDRAPDELLSPSPSPSPQSLPEVSKLSIKHSETQAPRRRGRGTFTYKKQGLYSDQQSDDSVTYDSPDEVGHDEPEIVSEAKKNLYGTHHVLVLDGFHPSTTTSDLERLFEDYRDRGLSVRWINDTLALAVFRTPSVAIEARDSLKCSFAVRVLEEDDPIFSYISCKDLELPRQRPKTSARTAQRLIAQELGVKMPLMFGSRELKKQEDARKSRIITRQSLRDEAWGPDDT